MVVVCDKAFDIPPFFEIYFLWWIFLILEFVVCAQMRACMPDCLRERIRAAIGLDAAGVRADISS